MTIKIENLALAIGNLCGKTEQGVKFQAARLMIEVIRGEPLSGHQQRKLYWKMQGWKPYEM
jgi:hypothetical protein